MAAPFSSMKWCFQAPEEKTNRQERPGFCQSCVCRPPEACQYEAKLKYIQKTLMKTGVQMKDQFAVKIHKFDEKNYIILTLKVNKD